MARRGENIFKRKDGRWEARVLEYRENGSRAYRSIYGRSYPEVKAKKEEYYGKVHQFCLPVAKKLATFAYLAESWLTSVKGTIKESSYTRYYRNVYSYLVPALGKYPIYKINSILVAQVQNALLSTGGRHGEGLSEKTVADVFSSLKMILIHASRHGYPIMNVSLVCNPRKKKREISVIPRVVVAQLEKILLESDETICLGILLSLHTGIRIGEVCGLRWGDFNFQSSSVQIRRTVERIADLDPCSKRKTKVIISDPKTDASRREIPLPNALCYYLMAHQSNTNCYLLTGTDKPSEPHTLYVRYERFLKRNGFSAYTFHALRHTFATRGMESGFDTKSLSEILGHADVTTTLRCYVHSSMEQKRKQMENLFDEKIRGQKYGI